MRQLSEHLVYAAGAHAVHVCRVRPMPHPGKMQDERGSARDLVDDPVLAREQASKARGLLCILWVKPVTQEDVVHAPHHLEQLAPRVQHGYVPVVEVEVCVPVVEVLRLPRIVHNGVGHGVQEEPTHGPRPAHEHARVQETPRGVDLRVLRPPGRGASGLGVEDHLAALAPLYLQVALRKLRIAGLKDDIIGIKDHDEIVGLGAAMHVVPDGVHLRAQPLAPGDLLAEPQHYWLEAVALRGRHRVYQPGVEGVRVGHGVQPRHLPCGGIPAWSGWAWCGR
mmetsp:Transcript_72616/g.164838  ORF Transcript_72616/g.164838 Transcript_72616/m.164838 type:complete len:280 (+) Transcript_72616:324-1163(+)